MKHFYIYKKHLSLIVLLLILKVAGAQNVGITDNSAMTTPNASAGLDIDFTNKGLLIPRIRLTGTTDNTSIASPATSLLVYNLAAAGTSPNNVVAGYYYNSSAVVGSPIWVRLSTGVSGWSTTGNIGTTPGTNFLGTTDDQDLVFKTGVFGKEIGRMVNFTGFLQLGDESKKDDTSYESITSISYTPAPSVGTLSAHNELVMRQDGDQYGSSIFKLRNRNGMNGAILETTTNSLTDLIFQPPSTIQSNIRYEGRSSPFENFALSTGSTTNSNYPEWQMGFPANPTLVISSATAANTSVMAPTGGNSALRFGNFGIGTATTSPFASDPTASLHIIRAGTATVGTAPMKFTSGVDLGAAEVGAFEFGPLTAVPSIPRLAFTPSGTTRKRFALTNDAAPANGQIPIGNGTDFTTASIVQGTGITITPGPGTLTIAGAGGVYSAGSGIQLSGTMFSNSYSLNGLSALTAPTQTFGTPGLSNLTWSSIGTTHNLNWAGPLAVLNGGTGATTLASGRLLQGNTTSAVSAFPLGSANQVLGINNAATAHEYKTITGGTNVAIDATTTGVIKVSATGIAAMTIFRAVITIPGVASVDQGTPITYTYNVPVVAGQSPVAANSTVILNPRSSISNGIVIAYVRAPSENVIVVGLTSTKNNVVFSATDFDITVIY